MNGSIRELDAHEPDEAEDQMVAEYVSPSCFGEEGL